MIFDPLEKAIADIKAGKMIILVDDADRENEGDLCCAAEKVTPEIINFMAKHGRGLICLSITSEVNTRLGLWPMTAQNTSNYGTNFTVSIEAAKGVTTGISAADRAHTILTAIDEKATAQSASMLRHKVNYFRRYFFRCTTEISFVFSISIIYQNNHLSSLNIGYGFF